MGKLMLNHKPSIEVHGFFGYLWFSMEILLGTAVVIEQQAAK